MAVRVLMTYIRPLLHHLLTFPGLPTMLFTPRPLLMSSVTSAACAKATSSLKVVMMLCPSESGGGLAASHSIVLLLADEREVFSFQIQHLDDLTLEFLFYPAFGSKLLVGLSLHCELLICNI